MTIKEIIWIFVERDNNHGDYHYASSVRCNLSDGKLHSYNTVIAQWHNGKLYINTTKYSVTTSRHQNYLKNLIERHYAMKCIYVDGVEIGAQDLLQYDKENRIP